MNIDCPLRIGANGRTASATDAKHIRDMIEMVLFTVPGERVMQPTLGTGLLQYVFAPNSGELAATLQFTVQGGLNQWLGDLVDVIAVAVQALDEELSVEISYAIRASGATVTQTFTRSGS